MPKDKALATPKDIAPYTTVITLLPCTVYWEILAAIKFGEMARNRLDKYLVNLKFSDWHDQ